MGKGERIRRDGPRSPTRALDAEMPSAEPNRGVRRPAWGRGELRTYNKSVTRFVARGGKEDPRP